MSDQFPPVPRDVRGIEDHLELYRSVLPEGRSAWYVSSPITTGRRLEELRSLQKHSNEALEELLAEHVIEPNRREAGEYVRRLRENQTRYVIDPTAVRDIDGWLQDDYRFFWGRVIESYVACVIFRDGWPLSSGCSYEFLIAARAHVTMLDERQSPLAVRDGIELLKETITQDNEAEANGVFRKAVLKALGEIQDVSAS